MFDNPAMKAFIFVAKWFPVVFVSAVLIWSYYAYVVQLCIYEIVSTTEKTIYLIFYHIFFILLAWSYWQSVFNESGNVPSQFVLTPSQRAQVEAVLTIKDYLEVKRLLDSFGREVPVLTKGYNGDLRYCEKCYLIKPDRAHHCSICERCVLKMDHHCPWINNCVCYNNYKFFVLFLGYGVLYCFYIACTDLQYFILFWRNELRTEETGAKFHILFLFFVSVMFAVSLSTLFSYHLYLTVTNRSTLESHRAPVFHGGPDKNGFNLGRNANFKEVFGDNALLWFLPVFTSKGDGTRYTVNSARNIPPYASEITRVESGPSLQTPLHGHSYNHVGRKRSGEHVVEDHDDLLDQGEWQTHSSVNFGGLTAVNSTVALINEHRS